MTRTLISLCLFGLLCGCAKKARPTTAEGDPVVALIGPKAGDPKPAPPALPVIPVRPALPAGWVEFKHPQEAFAVFLPTPPRPVKASEGSDLRQPVPVGRALASDYATDTADKLYCEVGVVIFSPELVAGVKAGDERKAAKLGPNIKRTPVTWVGHPAYEETEDSPVTRRVSVLRKMYVGNRMYVCSLYGQEPGRPTAADRTAVFDSFVVGK